MGYNLYIHRAEDWVDSELRPISRVEWHALIAADPELRIDADNGSDFAIWSGPCRYGENWLGWDEGRIFTKNPDRRTLAKMLDVATCMNARVQGDDGELYTRPEDLSGDDELDVFEARLRRPWWRFW